MAMVKVILISVIRQRLRVKRPEQATIANLQCG